MGSKSKKKLCQNPEERITHDLFVNSWLPRRTQKMYTHYIPNKRPLEPKNRKGLSPKKPNEIHEGMGYTTKSFVNISKPTTCMRKMIFIFYDHIKRLEINMPNQQEGHLLLNKLHRSKKIKTERKPDCKT